MEDNDVKAGELQEIVEYESLSCESRFGGK